MRRAAWLIAAALLIGSVTAEGERERFGVTLSCSAGSSGYVGCFLERPVLLLGPLEVLAGVDAQAAWSEARSGHLSAYAIVSWRAPSWSVWVEVAVPDRVPVIGRPDFARAGFAWTF